MNDEEKNSGRNTYRFVTGAGDDGANRPAYQGS